MTFFTSDTHFGHARIIEYCNRPFGDVAEMDQALIERWNYTVSPEDVVYHLGDFAMGPYERWSEYRSALNGRIILVAGNHDRSPAKMRAIGIDEVLTNVVVEVDGCKIWLNHYPPNEVSASRHVRPAPPATYNLALCGHVHNAWLVGSDGVVNVGVDVWNYQPLKLDHLISVAAPYFPAPTPQ